MNRRTVAVLALLSLSLLAGGCHKTSDETSESSTPAKPVASPLVGFEKDLAYIKNGQFTYIYVFSRKDGKPIQRDDSDFLRKEAPQMVDCVTTDEGKKAICGTNFNLEEGSMETLRKRFVVEDYTGR